MSTVTQRQRGWRIGSLAGVPVYLGRSWVVIAVLTTLIFGPVVSRSGADSAPGGYAVAFAFAVLLLVSVLVHEAAHALAARACGYRVSRIVADFWGGHTAYDGAGSTPGRAALVAISGPLANLVLALAGYLLLGVWDGHGMVWLLVTAFTAANGFVAVFNLLPGLPLDGGFLVDSLVWKLTGSRGLGTLVAGWCGRLLVLALAWWVVARPLLRDEPIGLDTVLWSVLIGGFLWMGATGAVRNGRARRALERIRVRDVCRPAGVVGQHVPVDQVPWNTSPLWLVTGPDGSPSGVVDASALAQVAAGMAGQTTVAAVTRAQPAGWVVDASPDDELTDVVVAMQTHQTPLIAVRRPDGTVVGVIAADDL